MALESLDRSRVKRFAEGRDTSRAEAFVAALGAHHAWGFARRPIDVVDLLNYWTEHGQFGSLAEVLEFSVTRNLQPPQRDRNDPLTLQQARDGAETLAAAAVMCRQLNFKAPDDALVMTGALDVPDCLLDDREKSQIPALLTRPIFDSASYGRVRFHHHRTTEYLAAKWFASRMAEGCPRDVLEQLLSDQVGNRRVMLPTLAPLADWLCIGEYS